MKIVRGIKPLCDDCRVIRRNGKVVIVHKGEKKCSAKA